MTIYDAYFFMQLWNSVLAVTIMELSPIVHLPIKTELVAVQAFKSAIFSELPDWHVFISILCHGRKKTRAVYISNTLYVSHRSSPASCCQRTLRSVSELADAARCHRSRLRSTAVARSERFGENGTTAAQNDQTARIAAWSFRPCVTG